jgi:cytochrome c-type biogenesis protein CcmH/NrfF
MLFRRQQTKRAMQVAMLTLALFTFLGAGDEPSRFKDLGHKLMCVCGCSQILLECNHVGCQYSDRMRDELMAAVERGDSDDLTMQAMVQKYGTTVIAAPTAVGFNRVAWIMPYVALVSGLPGLEEEAAGVLAEISRLENSPAVAPSLRPRKGPRV